LLFTGTESAGSRGISPTATNSNEGQGEVEVEVYEKSHTQIIVGSALAGFVVLLVFVMIYLWLKKREEDR